MRRIVVRHVAQLALDVFPQYAEVLVGRTSTVAGAKRLLDRAQAAADGVVIVVCAAELADGAGLDVLTYARRHHPTARMILLTNGERDQLVVSPDEQRGRHRRETLRAQAPARDPRLPRQRPAPRPRPARASPAGAHRRP
jgi:hypothetical protein